jgi:hypothetical protein
MTRDPYQSTTPTDNDETMGAQIQNAEEQYCAAQGEACPSLDDGLDGLTSFLAGHRGQIATGGAIAVCLVPALGWGWCAAAGAVALATRIQQRGRGHGSADAIDAGTTVASAGLLGGTSALGEEALGGPVAVFVYRLHASLADIFSLVLGH